MRNFVYRRHRCLEKQSPERFSALMLAKDAVLYCPTWSAAQTALEQSSLFLPTTAVCSLACVNRELRNFFDDASAKFWDDGNHPQFLRGKYSDADHHADRLVWLHGLVSLKCAAEFSRLCQTLQLRGNIVFAGEDEVFSLIRILQVENAEMFREAGSFVIGDASTRIATRFLVTWRFDPASIHTLLGGKSSEQVVSMPVRFNCKYCISFKLRLGVSRPSMESSELSFHLMPVEMTGGNYLNNFEIKASGTIIAPDMDSRVVNLNKAFGGALVREMEDDGCVMPTVDIANCRHFTSLTSLVSVSGECASMDGASWLALAL